MSDRHERTEQATPRRQEKLRDEGKVAQSHDVASAATLLVVVAAVAAAGPSMVEAIEHFTVRALRLQDVGRPMQAVAGIVPALQATVLPIIASAAVVSFALGIAQTRIFKLELAMPKAERLNPGPKLARMIPGRESAVELGKSVLKMAVLGVVVWQVLETAAPRFSLLASVEPEVAASEVGTIARKLAIHGGIAFAAIAAFDYWLARRKHSEDSKMSRQEVKDEHKQEEGDPLIKRRMRDRMREAVRRRAVGDVRKATVLVTNPTHISIALRYEPDRDAAPIVIAKGVDDVAMQMRGVARGAKVPIVENRPLARALHRNAKIGDVIPVELYKATAEVIAHVLRLKAAGVA